MACDNHPMRQPETWGHSTVRTACPLDCPDSCTLDVTVEKGRIVKIDGGDDDNPFTRGFICAKVRRFAERVYGEDRLLYPAVRKGAKGQGTFTRVTLGRGARPHRRADDRDPRRARRRSDPAVLLRRLERPAHAGHQRRDAVPRLRHVAAGAHGLRRADRRGQPGLYGKMPGVTYQDYPHARLIVLWGVNPAASGIHLVPFIKEAREAGARLVVIDPRATSLARQADLHLAVAARHRPAGRARDPPVPVRSGHADAAFLAEHTTGADELRARAERVDDRARRRGRRASTPPTLEQLRRALRRLVAGAGPLRLGARAQPQRRQRRGRGAGAAGGRRQVRRPRRRLLDEQLDGAGASRPRPG